MSKRNLEDLLNEKLTLEERIQKHKDFWARKPGSAPLIGAESPIEWGYMPYPLKDGTKAIDQMNVTADMINAKDLAHPSMDGKEPFHTDIIGVVPEYRGAWAEAIVNCEVLVGAHSVSGLCNKELTPDQRLYEFSVEDALNGEWFKLFKEHLQITMERNKEYPIRQPQLRGILDMLAAYLNETELCYAMYDDPDALRELGEKFIEVHNAIKDFEFSQRPLWNGGRASYWRIFVPGDCVDYQLDGSNMFSIEDYKEHFLPLDRKVLERYPYQVVHVHMLTGGYHIPSLLTIEKLTCIELHIDRECGEFTLESLKKHVDMIQEAGRNVIIYGALQKHEVQYCIDNFQNEGMAIIFWEPDPEWITAENVAQGKV